MPLAPKIVGLLLLGIRPVGHFARCCRVGVRFEDERGGKAVHRAAVAHYRQGHAVYFFVRQLRQFRLAFGLGVFSQLGKVSVSGRLRLRHARSTASRTCAVRRRPR